jgi:26S proteasome regulatory subunit N8
MLVYLSRTTPARERMIGWYHTGPKLRASDQEINDLMKRFIARPVMVIVDVRQQSVSIPTDAYFAVEEIKDVCCPIVDCNQLILFQDGTETRKTFLHVPSAIEAEEAEEIGVEHLLRDIKHATTNTLSTRVSNQLSSLRGLQSRLLEVRDYLRQVESGAVPMNHQIVYHLQDTLNLLPDLDDPLMTRSFTSNTNDQLLVVYLSSLVRAVIALHALVDNKASNLELEGGRTETEKKAAEKSSPDKEKKGDTLDTKTAPSNGK